MPPLVPGAPANALAARISTIASACGIPPPRLETLAARGTGSSNRVTRAVLLEEPPSIDRGEMTDKGSINQRAVLAHRAALVDALYADPADPRVLSALTPSAR